MSHPLRRRPRPSRRHRVRRYRRSRSHSPGLSGVDRQNGTRESRGGERQPRHAGEGISSARRVRPVWRALGRVRSRDVALRIGIDTGGTFTDLVAYDEDAAFVYGKQASTPDDPARALGAVLAEVDAADRQVQSMVVGTTVATNALLQRHGARVLLVTTAGFEDVPFIGRLDKEELYNLHWRKPAPLVSRGDCYGIPERVGHDGSVLVPLSESALDDLVAFVTARQSDGEELAVAVCLLFSYLAPEHEERIKVRLQKQVPGVSTSVSHEVSPTWREYERSSTTIGDAYIKPVLQSFIKGTQKTLERLSITAPVSMLKSNGGHLRLNAAVDQPAQFLISGEIKNCAGWSTAAFNRRWPPLDFNMLTGAVMPNRKSVSCTPAMNDCRTGLMYASPIVVLDRSYSRQVGETSCETEIDTPGTCSCSRTLIRSSCSGAR